MDPASAAEPGSVLKRGAEGATYHMAVSAVTLVLGFIRSVLLMRLLEPEQFGYVALAMFFMVFLAHLSTFGLDRALIQRQSPTRETFSTHLILRLLLALAALLLGLLASPLLRRIYADSGPDVAPRLRGTSGVLDASSGVLDASSGVMVDVLLALLLVNVLVASLSTPSAILKRDLRFGPVALLNLLSSIAMTIGAPLLAYLGAGVWSLVMEQAIGHLIHGVGLWVIRPWRSLLRSAPYADASPADLAAGDRQPAFNGGLRRIRSTRWMQTIRGGIRRRFDWDEARSLIRFGYRALNADLLGILLDRFDDFWAGTALGVTALGYYSRAYQIAQYPVRVLAAPVGQVFFPTFSALQDTETELTKAFFRSSSFLIRAGFLLALVLLVAIPEATLILFGEAWLPIVPIFRMMTIYVILDPLYVNLSHLVLGIGRPDLLVRVRLLQAASLIGCVIWFADLWGVQGIAMAANVMILVGVAALLSFSWRRLRFSLLRMLGWPMVALAAASAVGGALVYQMPSMRGTASERLWAAMIVKGLGVSCTFALVLGLAERRLIRQYGARIFRAPVVGASRVCLGSIARRFVGRGPGWREDEHLRHPDASSGEDGR